ncbi:MAG: hypothetical protein HC923_09390 [Myxococcales bacterium]|nr:hypothetical protein [Myxococcales bacterium]
MKLGRLLFVAAAFASNGCSLSRIASGALADRLAASSDLYTSDPDPAFVEAAVPFGLKTMEAVLEDHPRHTGLLVALTSGFASYGYAFVEQEAHRIEPEDFEVARACVRAPTGCTSEAFVMGSEAWTPASRTPRSSREGELQEALAEFEEKDVPLLYWTAAAWGLAIAASGIEPEDIADFPLVEALAARALELDEDWNRGATHDLLMVLQASKPGGDLSSAQQHFERAIAFNGGQRAGTFVSYAETVAVKRQNGPLFVELLNKALAIDVDVLPEERLPNVINQRRARRLLTRTEDLFIEDPLADRDGEAVSLNR